MYRPKIANNHRVEKAIINSIITSFIAVVYLSILAFFFGFKTIVVFAFIFVFGLSIVFVSWLLIMFKKAKEQREVRLWFENNKK
jgi:preprotein translocase subunit SecF